jgi:hypothetical protein
MLISSKITILSSEYERLLERIRWLTAFELSEIIGPKEYLNSEVNDYYNQLKEREEGE